MQFRLIPRSEYEICRDLGWTTMKLNNRVVTLITYSDEERPVYINASRSKSIAEVIANEMTADEIMAQWTAIGYDTGNSEELRKDAQSVMKQIDELHAAFVEEGFYEV